MHKNRPFVENGGAFSLSRENTVKIVEKIFGKPY